MSPEQAEMSPLDVDTRTDIYALGVLLYELLTGTTPFEKSRMTEAAYDELRRIIRDEEPPRPSARLSTLGQQASTVAERRRTDTHKLIQLVRGDLDWIVMKALEKDRTRRYETANDLARDIERFLNDEPVEARPVSNWYRLRKFARRNKAILTTACTITLILVTATVVSTWQAWKASNARQLADQRLAEAKAETAKANTVADLMLEMLGSASPYAAKGSDYTVRELLDEFSARLDDQLQAQPEVEAFIREKIGNSYTLLGMHDKAEPHFAAALEFWRRKHGASHPKVVDCLIHFARNANGRGDVDKALALARQEMSITKEHGDQASLMRVLTDVQQFLNHQGEWLEADAAGYEALSIARNFGLEETSIVGTVFQLLAVSKIKQGEHVEGERLARRALESARLQFGEDHPNAAWNLTTLAQAQEAKGDYMEAGMSWQEALRIFRKNHADRHWVVANTMRRLGQNALHQQDLASCEHHLHNSLEIAAKRKF